MGICGSFGSKGFGEEGVLCVVVGVVLVFEFYRYLFKGFWGGGEGCV